MAIPSKRGQQVTISANVWYDDGTRRVHVTSTDPDLGPGGLHTTTAITWDAATEARSGSASRTFIAPAIT